MFTTAVALVFVVPVGLVGLQLAHEGQRAVEWLRQQGDHGFEEPAALRHLPFGQTQVDGWWRQNLADPGSAKALVAGGPRAAGRAIWGGWWAAR